MKVLQFPNLTAASGVASPESVEPAIAAFQKRCFDAYRNRCTSRGLNPKYAEKCLSSVVDLLRWSGQTLPSVTEADYEAWTTHLANERSLLSTTQRTYQKGVRQVFKHLVKRSDLQNDAFRLFGQRIELVAHAENSIVHVLEDETGGRRPPLTHDQMEHLFSSIDAAIDLAEIECPRAVRGLQRDFTVIYTGYIYGLRVSELVDLRPDDWRASPELPELGAFGLLHVRNGKGTNGSGRRNRLVPTTHATYPDFLRWYLAHVRPLYNPSAKSNDPLFYNERNRKLTASSVQKAFKRLIKAANLDPTIYSPHTLRRSMCQHEMMRAPTELARAMAGHASASTTQIYGQVPAEYLRKSSARLVRNQLREMQETKTRD